MVDLDDAEIFFLVEIFKVRTHFRPRGRGGHDKKIHIDGVMNVQQSVCGVSVVTDYYELQKFNVMEIANEKNGEGKFREGEGRVHS